MKTTHNTQHRTIKNLLFNYFLYILGLFIACYFFSSCSSSHCCIGVQSKQAVNKSVVNKANFIKKRYNI